MAIYFREANWRRVRQCVQADGVAVIPLGSLEQHGPHLPCGTDTFQVNEFVKRAVQQVPSELPVCVCPTVEYSVVQWASPMASAGIQPLTLEQSLIDVCHALTDLGFGKIMLVHGHGGLPCGRSALWQALQEKRSALYVDFMPFDACHDQLQALSGEPVTHGGCVETSMMLAIRPDLVDISKAVKGPADLLGDNLPCPSLAGPGVYAVPSVTATREGIYGDPTRATPQYGDAALNLLAGATATIIRELASTPVPEHWKVIHTLIPVPKDK